MKVVPRKCRLIQLCILAAGCGTSTDAAGDLAALRAADAAWSEAAESNDVDRMLAHYDSTSVFLGNGVRTRESLRELWTNFFGLPEYHLSWELERAEVSGDGTLGMTYGRWEQSFQRDDGPSVTNGVYLAVWKRQADGSWKVLADKP